MIFNLVLMIRGWGIYCAIFMRWKSADCNLYINIIGLVPSGNKPLPELVLTQIYVSI